MSEEKSGKQELDVGQLQQGEAAKDKAKTALSNAFVKEHMSMVEAIASNVAGRGSLPTGIEFGDLVSWGTEGLIKAHRNYDESKGSAFKTYAYYRIRGEIFDRIRSEWQYRNQNDYREYRKQIQDRIAEVIEDAIETNTLDGATITENVDNLLANSAVMCLVSLDNVGEIQDSSGIVGEDDDSHEYSIVMDEINNLEDEEKRIMESFYIRGLKQKDIAEELNYSKSKICRIHMRILDKLRRRLKRRLVEV